MLKSIFTIIILLHGLIHLLGFAKAYNYVEASALTQEISKPAGIVWLLVSTLMITTSAFIWIKNDIWVYFGIVAVILSQVLCLMYWQDAKYGTIFNVLMAIVIIFGIIHLNFKSKYKHDVKTGIDQTSNIEDTILTKEDLQQLPILVQKYIRLTGSIGKPKVHSFRLTFSGKIRSHGTKKWMPLTSEQYNFLQSTTRLFFLDATNNQIPVAGYHRFKDGKASMDIRLLSLFSVQYMDGMEMNKSETVTFFNDMCCMAPATLIDPRIVWLQTEENSVKASFTYNGITITAWLHFNIKGELVNFISNDRYAANADGTTSNLTWSTPLRDYKEINGYHLASYAETIYTYPDGDFTYATFSLQHIDTNVAQ